MDGVERFCTGHEHTGDAFDGVFLCCPFPRDVLDETLDLIESVSEDFPTQSSIQPSLIFSSIW